MFGIIFTQRIQNIKKSLKHKKGQTQNIYNTKNIYIKKQNKITQKQTQLVS